MAVVTAASIATEIDSLIEVLTAMRCPRCGETVEKRNRDRKQAAAFCRACGRTFSLVRRHEGAQPREILPKPQEVREHRSPHRLWLSYRWFSLKKVIAGSFATAMAGGMTAGAVYVGRIESGWLLHAAPLFFGAITLLVGYGTLADLVNSTTVELTPERLRVQHGPVRFGSRNRHLHPMQLDQLFCRRRYVSGAANRSGHWTHDLVAVQRDGEQMTLIAGDRAERLLYIEQQLEQPLAILDRPTRGEYPRT